MGLRICAVFHSDKQSVEAGQPPAVAVNPPMTMTGMMKIDALVEKIRKDPRLPTSFDGLCSSRLARALDTASVLALRFDLDIGTMKGLGQMANKEGDVVIKYPGCETEDMVVWQRNAMSSVRELSDDLDCLDQDATLIVVSHRPIIGGLMAWSRGIIGDHGAIDEIVRNPELAKEGYVVFDYEPNEDDPDEDTIIEVPR